MGRWERLRKFCPLLRIRVSISTLACLLSLLYPIFLLTCLCYTEAKPRLLQRRNRMLNTVKRAPESGPQVSQTDDGEARFPAQLSRRASQASGSTHQPLPPRSPPAWPAISGTAGLRHPQAGRQQEAPARALQAQQMCTLASSTMSQCRPSWGRF